MGRDIRIILAAAHPSYRRRHRRLDIESARICTPMNSTISLCILALACGACSADPILEIGLIHGGEALPVRIQVPDSIKSGESARVEVVTYGGGCVSFEETHVDITEDEVEITPYDRRTVDRGGCPLILLDLVHVATFTFETAGPKVIRVNGRRTGAVAGEPFDEVVQMSFPVTAE